MRSVLVAAAAFALMEPLTALTHRVVMHGPGRRLHRSHHRAARRRELGREPESRWEANDLFPVAFAVVVLAGMAVGFNVDGWGVLVPIGVGVTLYGAAYALVHDVYIHERLPLRRGRTIAPLERLAEAHREHHRRDGAPYGMLLPVVPRTSASRSGSRPSHEPLDA